MPWVSCLSAWQGNKKRRETCALRPQNRGIAKRLNQMNNEETIFPRRDIYVGLCAKKGTQQTYIHRMSIDCFGPLFKILANLRFGLKTKCFLASVVFSPLTSQRYTFFYNQCSQGEYISSFIM